MTKTSYQGVFETFQQRCTYVPVHSAYLSSSLLAGVYCPQSTVCASQDPSRKRYANADQTRVPSAGKREVKSEY